MACSCSHWWHAPAYLIFCAILGFLAIFSSLHFNPKTHFPISSILNPPSIFSNQSFFIPCNASQALRDSGFSFMATILEITPELFLPDPQSSSSSSSTIFAIHDLIITNISLPPFLFKLLLQYHTSPLKLTIEDLTKKPQGSCIPTLVDEKKLIITKSRDRVEINGVLISHPDIFNDDSCSIHGVLKPFSILDQEKSHLGLDLFPFPDICDWISSSNSTQEEEEEISRIPWNQILRLLSSNGFTSFAIGLNSVLDHGILQDPTTVLNSVTIFAPQVFDYMVNASSSSSPLLERTVRFHILPERFSYKELVSLPVNASLRTLVPDMDVQITEGFDVKEIVSVNGVEIMAPDVLSSSDKFIVHGISQPLKMM